MTIASQTSRVEYLGDGSTTTFAVPFYFQANADIIAYTRDAGGNSTLQVLGTNYTLSGTGVSTGGSLTFITAPASAIKVIIYRDPPLTQATSYNNNDPFPAKSHEAALDKMTTIAQRTRDMVTRAVHLNDADSTVTMLVPMLEQRKGKIAGYSAVDGSPALSNNTMDSLDSVISGALATAGGFNRIVLVSTHAALLTTVPFAGAVIFMQGFYANGDGGEGVFYWNASSTATVMAGLVVQPQAGGTGRWIRIDNRWLSPRMAGAKGDGSTDDRAAFANISSFISATGIVVVPPGTYSISSNVTVNGRWIIGDSATFTGAGTITYAGQFESDTRYYTKTQVDGSVRYTLPAAFSWSPFQKYFVDGFGQASANYDVLDYWQVTEPNPSSPIYVSYANGSDAAGGGAPNAPYKTIKKATDLNTSCIIYLMDDGTHYCLADVTIGAASIVLKSFTGRPVTVRFATDPTTPTFVSDSGGGFANVYKAATSAPTRVFDTAQSTGSGDYVEMTNRASEALVNANPGSWFHDGTNLFVRMYTDRTPAPTILITNSKSLIIQGNKSIYIENVVFEGGSTLAATQSSSVAPRVYMKGGGWGYAGNNTITAAGANIYTQDAVFHHPGLDNLNYAASSSVDCKFIEFNVTCRDSSSTSTISNNASTSHDNALGIRLNGKYYNCNGPVIGDTTNSKTYNICTDAYRANVGGTAQFSASYYSQGTSIMYLHKPRSRLSQYDYYLDGGGAVINYRNDMSNGASFGTPTAFIPTVG